MVLSGIPEPAILEVCIQTVVYKTIGFIYSPKAVPARMTMAMLLM